MKPISRSPEKHAYGEARNGIDELRAQMDFA